MLGNLHLVSYFLTDFVGLDLCVGKELILLLTLTCVSEKSLKKLDCPVFSQLD